MPIRDAQGTSRAVDRLKRTVLGRVTEVDSSAGVLHPGAVIFATGDEPKLPSLSLRMRCRKVKGHLLATEPAPFRLRVSGAGIPTQLEDGSLLAGGTVSRRPYHP